MGITQYRDYPIREVWAENLNEEMAKIALILENYNYVAMDTEFPGVLARPIGTFKSKSEYNYRTLGLNVDMLKIIQLGLAFADSEGNSPKECACWQFNFEFNLLEDMYAQDTIDLLTDSGMSSLPKGSLRGQKVLPALQIECLYHVVRPVVGPHVPVETARKFEKRVLIENRF
mmetsp:Transcript_18427/g.73946  ORF Transcript_18427/g.73946 Transcript_18427/m.73946 type:complete len:173 (+) Transcript_18427:369-887(+)